MNKNCSPWANSNTVYSELQAGQTFEFFTILQIAFYLEGYFDSTVVTTHTHREMLQNIKERFDA